MTPLHARHSSVIPKGMQRVRNMEAVGLDPETRKAFEEIALGIYTDMVNSGQSLQATVLAIYLSGLQHGAVAQKEQENAD